MMIPGFFKKKSGF